MKYQKTEAGQQAFKARSPSLSARQRSAFILFDGIKTTEQVLVSTTGLGITQADVDHMLAQGFIVAVSGEAAALPGQVDRNKLLPVSGASAGSSPRSSQDRYKQAYPLATQLTASLGLRGFRLNLAVEAAAGYDDLLALFPKIQDAVGEKASRPLLQALKG